MGLYDRDYSRSPTQRSGGIGGWSVTVWLIVINAVVHVLDPVLAAQMGYPAEAPPLFLWGHFSTSTAIFSGQLWRFITFQFLHADLLHIGVNMFMLYMFGRNIEAYLGRWRYLLFYLLCGIAGPLMYMLFWGSGLLIGYPWIPMVGASAGVYGVVIATARLAPDARVMLIFFPQPVKLKWVALGYVVLAMYVVLTSGRNAGGEAAHLGGAVVGFMLITRPYLLSPIQALRRRRSRYD